MTCTELIEKASHSIGLNDLLLTSEFRLCSEINGEAGRFSHIKLIFGVFISSVSLILSQIPVKFAVVFFIFEILSVSVFHCAGVVKFFHGQLKVSSHHLA